jgi:hypothetical protein
MISNRNISKQVEQMKYNVSAATVHRIQHVRGAFRNNIHKRGKSGSYTTRRTGATVDVECKVRNMDTLINSLTLKKWQQFVRCHSNRVIANILKAKLKTREKVPSL